MAPVHWLNLGDLEWYEITAILEDETGKKTEVQAADQEDAEEKGRKLYPNALIVLVRSLREARA
jgi:hypothetical protein